MSFESGEQNLAQTLANNNAETVDANTTGLSDHFNPLNTNDPFGLASISLTAGRIAGNTMSGAFASEKYNTLLKTMQEFASNKNHDQSVMRHVIALDKSVAPTVHFSSILVVVQSRKDPAANIGYQILVVDGTNVPLQNLESHNGSGMTESIDRFAEVVIDAQLRTLAQQRIMNVIPGVTANKLVSSNGVVLGDEVDANNTQQVYQILANAVLAASSAAAYSTPGAYNELNLAAVMSAKNAPELYISHTPSKSVYAADEVGGSYRVSFVSKLQTGKASKNRSESPNSGQGAQSLIEVGTFADLAPVMASNGANPFAQAYANQQAYMYGMQQPMQPLRPLVVMTTVRSTFALTPGAIELGAIIAGDQVRSNRWAEDFRHKGNPLGTSVDFGNVGAILVNMPNPQAPGQYMGIMDASSPMFTDETLWDLLGNYVRNSPLLAIDVPTATASSWYLGMYAALAAKNPKALEFYRKTLNTMTNGHYDRLVQEKHNGVHPNPFADEVFYMERGTWRSGDKILPIELLDNYVAVCSFAAHANRPALVDEYVATLTAHQRIPQITRLLTRRKIINEMSDGTAKFTRSVKRCIFNPVHRNLVVDAMVAADVIMHSDEGISLNLGTTQAFSMGLANLPQMTSTLNVQGQIIQGGTGFGMGNSWMGF